MINAKYELRQFVLFNRLKLEDIRAVSIRHEDTNGNREYYYLREDYQKEELSDFLDKLDFSYPNILGNERIAGVIWFKNGSWAIREHKYENEVWRLVKSPDIKEKWIE